MHLQLSWIKTKVCVLFQTVHTHVCILLCSHMDLYNCVLNLYFCTRVMFGVQQKHISFRVYILFLWCHSWLHVCPFSLMLQCSVHIRLVTVSLSCNFRFSTGGNSGFSRFPEDLRWKNRVGGTSAWQVGTIPCRSSLGWHNSLQIITLASFLAGIVIYFHYD